MTILIKGYGGQAIPSWGLGDLIILTTPVNIGAIFKKTEETNSLFEQINLINLSYDKINTLNSLFGQTNKVNIIFKRVISEEP